MSSSYAIDESHVQGAWELVSYEVEVQETGERFHPMGDKPSGYVILTSEK